MLTKLKSRHIKKILWATVVVIIVTFVFWGASSFRPRKESIVGEIENHLISTQEFAQYIKLAQLHLIAQSTERPYSKLTAPAIERQAWQFYLLLKKTQKEKIQITDNEVIGRIQKMFSRNGKFDKDWYFRAIQIKLQVKPRIFEEYIRKHLTIEELFEKHIQVDVKEEEIIDAYRKDNEKAKIGYLLIPCSHFEPQIELTEEKLQNFYQENKELLEEEPQVKMSYIFIAEEAYPSLEEELKEKLTTAKSLKEVADSSPDLAIHDTDFVGAKSPIEGIGWEPEIIKSAFLLPVNTLSKIQRINNGYIVFEKKAEKQARLPSFEEVKDKVTKKVIEKETRLLAQGKGEEIISEITSKKVDTLSSMAKTHHSEYKETDYFKYYDYIEGVGLNEELSKAVFNAEKGTLIAYPFLLSKGVYIIQLLDLTPINEENYAKEKNTYKEKIMLQKDFLKRIQFLMELEKEFKLKIYSSFFQEEKSQ